MPISNNVVNVVQVHACGRCIDWRSTESVTLLAPERLTRLKGGSPTVAIFGMTSGRGHIYLSLFTRICVAIILLWWRLCVLEATLNLAPTLFGFSALSAISIDALFGEIVGAAAGDYEDSPAITDRSNCVHCYSGLSIQDPSLFRADVVSV